MASLNHPSLQVIIPFRGSLAHLEECVNETKLSLPQNCKILVFDDRSNFSERPSFLLKDEYIYTGGIGLPQVIETSKNYITSDYIALMAGDDIPVKNRFSTQLELLETHNFDLCLGRQSKFKQSKIRVPALAGSFLGNEFDSSLLLLGPYGADGTIMMTSMFYYEKYALDPNDSFSDWALALRHYPDSKIAYINSVLVHYRQHSGQVTRNARNLWGESSVKDNWLRLLFKLTNVNSVSNGAFNVIAAPWYRSQIHTQEINEAVNILNKIINRYQQNNLSYISIASIERIIIRRLIFRIDLFNVFFILIQLHRLNISKIYLKTMLETLTLLKELVFSIGNSPRLITPSGEINSV